MKGILFVAFLIIENVEMLSLNFTNCVQRVREDGIEFEKGTGK